MQRAAAANTPSGGALVPGGGGGAAAARVAAHTAAAVEWVIDDRKAQMLQLHPDLMRTAVKTASYRVAVGFKIAGIRW
eukprot:COSAG01_NODE_2842_length_6990_cov_10.019301_5_plen_78_part_00